jgi:hypothetical protein
MTPILRPAPTYRPASHNQIEVMTYSSPAGEQTRPTRAGDSPVHRGRWLAGTATGITT